MTRVTLTQAMLEEILFPLSPELTAFSGSFSLWRSPSPTYSSRSVWGAGGEELRCSRAHHPQDLLLDQLIASIPAGLRKVAEKQSKVKTYTSLSFLVFLQRNGCSILTMLCPILPFFPPLQDKQGILEVGLLEPTSSLPPCFTISLLTPVPSLKTRRKEEEKQLFLISNFSVSG